MAEYTITVQRSPLKKTVTFILLHAYRFEPSKIRFKPKDRSCHLCKRKFERGEWLSEAEVRGYKKHLICEECADFLTYKEVPYKRKKG